MGNLLVPILMEESPLVSIGETKTELIMRPLSKDKENVDLVTQWPLSLPLNPELESRVT